MVCREGEGRRASHVRPFDFYSTIEPPQCRIIAAIYTGPPNVLITTSNARAWITPLLCALPLLVSWYPRLFKDVDPSSFFFFFFEGKFGRIYSINHSAFSHLSLQILSCDACHVESNRLFQCVEKNSEEERFLSGKNDDNVCILPVTCRSKANFLRYYLYS